jgi:hypothetical protein
MIGRALQWLIARLAPPPPPEPEPFVACAWPDCARFWSNPYRDVRLAVRMSDCACEHRRARERGAS